jgi:hypothetical protein
VVYFSTAKTVLILIYLLLIYLVSIAVYFPLNLLQNKKAFKMIVLVMWPMYTPFWPNQQHAPLVLCYYHLLSS